MDEVLGACLEDLEARLDARDEERILAEWRAFADGRFDGEIFSPRRAAASAPRMEWPAISVNEALESPTAMLLQQFGACSRLLAGASGLLLNVRCNYGTPILPLLFGVPLFTMPPEMDTLPTVTPFNDMEAVKRVLAAGVPNLEGGFGSLVFETGRRFAEIARAYPKIGEYVHIYHPDTQGPLDLCELVWGSSVFTAVYDEPQMVHELLSLVTETYIAFLRKWQAVVPFESDGNCHWGYYHRGAAMLRMDSATNLSPSMYERFAFPCDQRILDAFGGGAVHFCGRGDHYIEVLAGLRGLNAVNVSQPHLNNMERIFAHTVDRGINLLGLDRQAAESALAQRRDVHGRIHCTD